MLHRRLAARALISSLTVSGMLLTVMFGNSAMASPPGGGGGFGRPSTADWIGIGIGAAQAIRNSRQNQQPRSQPRGRSHQQPNYQQPQQNYYPPAAPTYQAPPQVVKPAAPVVPPVTIQANAIPEQKVEPQENAVPMTDAIVPLRKREARCYQHSIEENITNAGQAADDAWKAQRNAIGEQLLQSLGQLIADPAVLQQITELLQGGDFGQAREQAGTLGLSDADRQALERNLDAAQQIDQKLADLLAQLNQEGALQDVRQSLDALAAAISELAQAAAVNPQAPPQMDAIIGNISDLADLLLIRDLLAQAANGDGPAQFTPIDVTMIPTGVIRVIYDPELPVGTGLWVNEGCIIAGSGGRGELQTGIASAAEALGLPVAPGMPVADLGDDEQPPKGGVLIGNPEENSGAIKYVLASVHPYDLQPGFKQHLPGTQSWLIEFDRGGTFGAARYTLSEGIYDFKVGEKGWDLVSRPLKAVIDNSEGKDDFYYLQDNERKTVKAGETRIIEAKSPVVISFDRGNEDASRKLLNKSGTYKVAVNIDDNRYDLFEPVGPEQTPADAGAIAGSGE